MAKRPNSILCIPKEGGSKTPFWLDLPQEIFEVIMSKLSFGDQVCLRAVCKMWRSIGRVPSSNRLPWCFMWQGNSCKLFELFKKYYTFNSKTLEEKSPRICSSKKGWILARSDSLFFLYNPFTDETIELPPFDINPNPNPNPSAEYVATFSSPPTSPDCRVYVIESDSLIESTVYIRGYNPKEKIWTTTIFKTKSLFAPFNNVIFSGGIFYCENLYYELINTFNIAEKLWRAIESPYVSSNSFMVESNGEIFIGSTSTSNCPISYRLDRSTMSWVKINGLEGKALFWAQEPYLLEESETPEILIDMVVYIMQKEDGQLYAKAYSDPPTVPALSLGTSVESGTSNSGNTAKRSNFFRRTWIEPPI